MDRHRSGFLWNGDKNKKKYHVVSWPTICLPKDKGGLDILDLDIMNISLLSNWHWKLFNEKGGWKILLEKQYLKKVTLGQDEAKPGNSHFWQGLMDRMSKYCSGPVLAFKLEMGKNQIWEDILIGESSLANTIPGLYSVSKDHNITVASVINSGVENLKFRRALVGERGSLWDALRNLCRNVVLNDNEEDRLIWTL
jgi:hypothetical protein